MTSETPHVRFDWNRKERTGVPEAVFCEGKSIDALLWILNAVESRAGRVFLTRLDQDVAQELATRHNIDYCPVSRTAIFGAPSEAGMREGEVAVLCGGTSDLPVVEEARRTLTFHGHSAPLYADVGVAGLWRLTSVAEELAKFRILIAVAGMEGALFSVVGGLVPGLIIAVPSPIGYGMSKNGDAALSSALSSCSPGIVTVNIGNGFGAAIAAIKLLRAPCGQPES